MSRSQPTSAQLKEEGNALFKEHNYTAARSKYTQSLALNGTNAVVYANRALCALKLKLYEEAERDAQRSIKRDPSYHKAWARLASSQQLQGEFASSIASWEKAISLLKSYSVTSADQRLRQEYEAGLSAARASQKEPPASARLTRPSVAAKESVTSSSASVRPPPSPKTAVQPHSSAIARQPFAARASEEAERPFMFQMLRRLSDYNEGHDPDAAKMLKTPHDMEMEAAEDPDLFRETMRKVKMNASFTFQVIGAGLTSKLDNPATEKEQRETDKIIAIVYTQLLRMSFVPCDILSPDERDQAIGYVVRYLVNFDPANPAASGLFSVYIRMVMPDLAEKTARPEPEDEGPFDVDALRRLESLAQSMDKPALHRAIDRMERLDLGVDLDLRRLEALAARDRAAFAREIRPLRAGAGAGWKLFRGALEQRVEDALRDDPRADRAELAFHTDKVAVLILAALVRMRRRDDVPEGHRTATVTYVMWYMASYAPQYGDKNDPLSVILDKGMAKYDAEMAGKES